ncbi:MAG: carboxymuconolactone decarboxylase family protein [Burkholderiales bacterium]|nr:carboxymuconolactone decarboxylase family protein [Burkholderiales bacterium]
MSRLIIPAIEQSPVASQPLLAGVNQQLGMVPNLMRVMSHSPAALEGYLSFNAALGKGALSNKLREQIALTVAEYNGCEYCLAAHTYLGKNLAKLSDAEIEAARALPSPYAAESKTNAALQFAYEVADKHGHVSDATLSKVREAGFAETEIIEIVLNVAINVLTNYVNNVTRTDVDFPKANVRFVK